MKAVVMAIRSEHANRIYSGEKRFEFRRIRPRFTKEISVYVYEPAPVQAVTGHFCVAEVLDVAGNLSELEEDAIARADVGAYLTGASKPTAIRIAKPTRLSRQLPLSIFGVKVAPQSYVYVSAG